jgi:cell shape-determining protein MreD
MYDIAINGIIKHSKLPLRFFTIIGFITSIFSIIFALIYFFYKILYWNEFTLGIAPIVIGLFALGSVNIFLLGLIGEYVLSILNQVRNIPIVYEKERINF